MQINREVIIKDTHRGLWYEDGILIRILEAGRYRIPGRRDWLLRRRKHVEVVVVDHPALLRLRELEALRALAGNSSARLYIGFARLGVPAEHDGT